MDASATMQTTTGSHTRMIGLAPIGTFVDRRLHPTPLLFTSPLANGTTNYSTIAFETDLPRIEADDSQDNPPFCDRTTGANCVNPPTERSSIRSSRPESATGPAPGRRAVTSFPEPFATSEGVRQRSSGRCCRLCIQSPASQRSLPPDNFNSGTCRTRAASSDAHRSLTRSREYQCVQL